MKRTPVTHPVRRYGVLCVGLAILALGIAFSIKAGLGTSPISSLPYVVSLFAPMSVGVATIALHCVLILMQMALLRKNYDPVQLIQLPVAILFGYLMDLSVWLIRDLPCEGYGMQWVYCIVGIVLVGIGVSFEVTANVVTLAGEGAVLALCQVFPVPFPRAKVAFDSSLVLLAVVLSLAVLGYLAGVREGTAAAALLVGVVAKQGNRTMAPFAQRYLA
ncbi:MAG: DUF6198 family protein [Evtepia sp.]|uniref:YczE/YyaS/YitT family protein n=1 Tax=Evtepia sp. TaxID=2773933 RepID=UPI002A762DD9|nr:DUF6198 family protein [Evtepia sp.]MDY3014815.1 DUF6198 family protein [Evtepia sp.]